MIVEFKRLFKKKPTTLLELFKYIKNTGISDNEKVRGICYLVFEKYNIVDKENLQGLFKNWPHYSGLYPYPIPPFIGYKRLDNPNICNSIETYHRSFDMKWDKSTNYGKARWNFVEWAIDELEGKHV